MDNGALHTIRVAQLSLSFLAMASIMMKRNKKRRRKRRWWVRPSISRRFMDGEFHRLVQAYKVEESDQFCNTFRMTPSTFYQLLELIRDAIQKKDTGPREPIGPAEKLAVTLKFLATGDLQKSIADSYRLGRATVSKIIVETCDALWERLQPLYLPLPDESLYSKIETEFSSHWNFPNCIGAIDGRRIVIKAPAKGGSNDFNDKGSNSIVLLAACDGSYNFTVIDIVGYGRQSDAETFRHSAFGGEIIEGQHCIPNAKPLPGTSEPLLPFIFVADEAFPLLPNLLRPYSGQGLTVEKLIFNYRLSRARWTIENSFGILAAKWHIFLRGINMKVKNIEKVVKATIVLHNFTRISSMPSPDDGDVEYQPGQWRLGSWRREIDEAGGCTGLQNIEWTGVDSASSEAIRVREQFTDYFNSPAGRMPWDSWQDSVI